MQLDLKNMVGETKDNILIGKDEYLFLHRGGHSQFDYLTSVKVPTENSINNFASNIGERVEYFNERNIIYKHIVFPSKPLIKKEFLPDKYHNIESVFDKYYKNALDPILQQDVLYPLQELEKAEEYYSTFFIQDTHNNDYGYLVITNLVLQQINLTEISHNSYKILEKDLHGACCRILGIDNIHKEVALHFSNSNFSLYDNRKFLPGNTNNIIVAINYQALHKKRLLIFGDSFFAGMLHILGNLFSEILFIRSSFIHKDIIDRFKPDIVFTGNAERYLAKVQSDRNSHDILLSLYGDKGYHPDMNFLNVLKAQLSYGYYKSKYDQWKNNFLFKDIENYKSIIDTIQKVAIAFEVDDSIKISKNIIEKQDYILERISIEPNFKTADILRDIAIVFEKGDDIQTAKIIMEKALLFRQNGPIIKKKIEKYRSILASNEL